MDINIYIKVNLIVCTEYLNNNNTPGIVRLIITWGVIITTTRNLDVYLTLAVWQSVRTLTAELSTPIFTRVFLDNSLQTLQIPNLACNRTQWVSHDLVVCVIIMVCRIR